MNILNVKENFEKRGLGFEYFETAQEAKQHIITSLKGKVITFGGSVTCDELGLYDELKKENDVHSHVKTPGDFMQTPDVYITSANALTSQGEIINIDGRANRVAASIYGSGSVLVICGKNKLCNTLEEAIFRARNIAGPKNAKRLNRNTPCAIKADKCYDCNSEERICSVLAITMNKPMGISEYKIIFINENLGY